MRYDIVVKEMAGMEITGTGDGGVSAEVPVGRNVLEVPSDVDRLYEVIGFVKESLGGLGVSERAMAQIELVVEEIYVNIASYAYPPGTGKVWVGCDVSEDTMSVTLTFTDCGPEFDPLKSPEPDTGAPLEERSIGGLGIFLVKRNVDGISYRRRDGYNILTIEKNLG